MNNPTVKEITVKDIVEAYLRKNGFDGLYSEDCGCEVDDLFPCMNIWEGCRAGYKVPCDCMEGCRFHIGPEKVEGDE